MAKAKSRFGEFLASTPGPQCSVCLIEGPAADEIAAYTEYRHGLKRRVPRGKGVSSFLDWLHAEYPEAQIGRTAMENHLRRCRE